MCKANSTVPTLETKFLSEVERYHDNKSVSFQIWRLPGRKHDDFKFSRFNKCFLHRFIYLIV